MAPALVICDVWDTHWCATARQQADDLAPRINDLAAAVRRAGGVVIHAPSQTGEFYATWNQREQAREAAAPLPLRRPRPVIELPTYQACPCQPSCATPDLSNAWPWPWSRQHPRIDITEDDFVACEDADAVYGVTEWLSASPVALCGLHLDECILDRPFGAKALWSAGVDVVILEDLTEPTHPDDRRTIFDAISAVLPTASSAALIPR